MNPLQHVMDQLQQEYQERINRNPIMLIHLRESTLARLQELDYIQVYARRPSLPVVTIETPRGECSICQSAYQVGDTVVPLPCHTQHCFHKDCIRPWLDRHDTCPLCRAKV